MGMARAFAARNDAGWAFASHMHAPPTNEHRPGMYLGTVQPTNRWFGVDEYLSRSDGLRGSSIHALLGNKGAGKSLTTKVLACLAASQQVYDNDPERPSDVRGHVYNRKFDDNALNGDAAGMEWIPTMKMLGAERVRYTEQRYALFDPDVDDDENLRRAFEYWELLGGLELRPEHTIAARIALDKMRSHEGIPFTTQVLNGALRSVTLADVEQFHAGIDADMRENLELRSVSPEAIQFVETMFSGVDLNRQEYDKIISAAIELADILVLVIKGKFGKMFTGADSFTDELRKPALIFDYDNMTEVQINLIDLMRVHAIKFADYIGDKSVAPHFAVHEEVQKAFSVPYLRNLTNQHSVARGTPTQEFITTQYFAGFDVGAPDSELNKLAKQFTRGFDTYLIGSLPNDKETVQALRDLQLSERLIGEIVDQSCSFAPGEMVYVAKGATPFKIQVLAPESFIEKYGRTRSASDRQVNNRRPADSFNPALYKHR